MADVGTLEGLGQPAASKITVAPLADGAVFRLPTSRHLRAQVVGIAILALLFAGTIPVSRQRSGHVTITGTLIDAPDPVDPPLQAVERPLTRPVAYCDSVGSARVWCSHERARLG